MVPGKLEASDLTDGKKLKTVEGEQLTVRKSGDKVTIEGHIVDGDGNAVNDAVVEIWQANAQGRYAHPDDTQDKPLEPTFKGFGRVTTDKDGMFRFTTIKPGRVPAPGAFAPATVLVIPAAVVGTTA